MKLQKIVLALTLLLFSCLGSAQTLPAPKGGVSFTSVNVSDLPTASAANKNNVRVVNDAATAGNCTTGGGSAQSVCISNGVAWIALGSGSGSYTLPVAGSSIGGVKAPNCQALGSNYFPQSLSIDGSWNCVVVSSGGTYTLPALQANILGGIKGTGSSLSCGTGKHVTGFDSSGVMQCADDPIQVQADWNAYSGVAQILNKPSNLVTPAGSSGDLQTNNGSALGSVPQSTFIDSSALDTDGTLAANSDARIPSQKAVKSYVSGVIGSIPPVVTPYSGGGSNYSSWINCTNQTFGVASTFTAASSTQTVAVFSVPAYWHAVGFVVSESTTITTSNSQITALVAQIQGASGTPFTLPFALMGASPGGFASYDGGFYSAATSEGGTQSIYLLLSVANSNPGNLGTGSASNLTAGSITVKACGVVIQ